MSSIDRQSLYRLLYSFNQENYRTRDDGYSLLHLSLNDLVMPSHQFIDHFCEYSFTEQRNSSSSLIILLDIHVYIPFELFYTVALIRKQLISMVIHHCISLSRVQRPVTRQSFRFYVMLVCIWTMQIS